MDTVSCVALTNVAVRVCPFTRAETPETNPLPLTVSVKAAPPPNTVFGLNVLSTGTPFKIENELAFDTPPPGAAFATVISALPDAVKSLAGMAAVNCVALTKVVARALPFQRTVEPLTKPVPLTVSVIPLLPAVAEAGDNPLIVGAGLLIVNDSEFEAPPLVAATETLAVPAAVISLAGICAVSCVPLTKVVVRLLPFQRTVAPLRKPEPVTVKVKPAPPAMAAFGVKVAIVSVGALMAKVSTFDVPPPGEGVTTDTFALPTAATSLAAIVAVNCVPLTKFVGRSLPFHNTVEPLMKPVPVTVSVKAELPAAIEVGLSAVSAGMPLVMVNGVAFEVPPPGAGVTTVTLGMPAAAKSLAGICAVSWVPLTKVVARLLLFQRMVEPLTKPVPFTVKVIPALPVVAVFGLIVVTTGVGLLTPNVSAAEVPPPGAGETTVTLAVAAVVKSLAGMAAVSCVALTKLVVRLLPFHCTVEPLTKPEPFTVKVNPALPTAMLDGASEVATGAGLSCWILMLAGVYVTVSVLALGSEISGKIG